MSMNDATPGRATSDPSAAPAPSRSGTVSRAARVLLTAVAVAGLAYDAYAHFDLASNYDAIKTSSLSQGELFRVEGAAAGLAALGLLVRPRRYTTVIALLVAAGGLAAVLAYRYYNIKSFGPVPAMYEPLWYPEKTRTAYAEAAATLASAGLFVLIWPGPRAPRRGSRMRADRHRLGV